MTVHGSRHIVPHSFTKRWPVVVTHETGIRNTGKARYHDGHAGQHI